MHVSTGTASSGAYGVNSHRSFRTSAAIPNVP